LSSGVDLEGELHRVDPDRWLASRFITDRGRRADVVALYAFDHELARPEAVTTSPLAAEIRLVWWRETVAEIVAGGAPRAHPTAEALAAAIQAHDLPGDLFDDMIEARVGLLGRQSLTPDEASDWAWRSQGRLARLAALTLGAGEASRHAEAAGAVWGLLLLRRSGRAAGAPLDEVLVEARREARGLPTGAFPAALPATLARCGPSEIEKRLRLTWAALTGRI
jgi:phytoene synthase